MAAPQLMGQQMVGRQLSEVLLLRLQLACPRNGSLGGVALSMAGHCGTAAPQLMLPHLVGRQLSEVLRLGPQLACPQTCEAWEVWRTACQGTAGWRLPQLTLPQMIGPQVPVELIFEWGWSFAIVKHAMTQLSVQLLKVYCSAVRHCKQQTTCLEGCVLG